MDSGHDDDSAALNRIVFVLFFFYIYIYIYTLCGPRSFSEWHVSSIEIDGEQNKKKKKTPKTTDTTERNKKQNTWHGGEGFNAELLFSTNHVYVMYL